MDSGWWILWIDTTEAWGPFDKANDAYDRAFADTDTKGAFMIVDTILMESCLGEVREEELMPTSVHRLIDTWRTMVELLPTIETVPTRIESAIAFHDDEADHGFAAAMRFDDEEAHEAAEQAREWAYEHRLDYESLVSEWAGVDQP